MSYAIKVSNLGKQYTIGASQSRYKSLRDSLTQAVRAPFQRFFDRGASTQERNIWALKDVSFEIAPGEVVGIIGRNGAGKSTLLKLLARITEPTEGEIRLRGRIGSLLEVGVGFHSELTGRENILLNGAILGMAHKETERKFDEIVDFAEVEKFIDTPVKHYSSGMYMRLAFAVAAHLEPEILLVDEVLAVGDGKFQKKCLGKMEDVAQNGRTVIFVSHNMTALQSLCRRGIVIHLGKLDFSGEINKAIEWYMKGDDIETGVVDLTHNKSRFGSGEMNLLKFWIEDEIGNVVNSVPSGCRCALAVEYKSADGRQRRDVSMSIHINSSLGTPITLINTHMLDQHFQKAEARGVIRFLIPKLPLTAGRYLVDLNLATHAGLEYADFLKSAAGFDVIDGDFYGTGYPGNPGAPVIFDGRWEIQEIEG